MNITMLHIQRLYAISIDPVGGNPCCLAHLSSFHLVPPPQYTMCTSVATRLISFSRKFQCSLTTVMDY